MAEVDWKKFIQNSELLGTLSKAEITQLLKPEASEEKRFSAGDAIIKQEEKGRSFYIIGSGSLAISRPAPEGGEINLAVLEPGEFFGEMALLSQQPRSANVKAREDCIVLRINAASLRDLLNQHPEILAGIFMMLSERLRDLAARVVDVSYHDVNNKLELFSTKLDAELKAVNSTLAATQVVFDQTAQRANDVITGTERYWKRLTMIGTLITTMLVTGLSWFGVTSYKDIEAKKNDIIKEADDAAKMAKELQAHISALKSGATYSVVPMLQGLDDRDAKGAQYYLPILQSNLQLVLSSDDENSTTIIFKELYDWMTFTLINAGQKKKASSTQSQADFDAAQATKLDNFHNRSDIILSGVVDSEHDIPLRNKALSFYFLLANLAIDQNFNKFDIHLNELNKVLRDSKEPRIIWDVDKKYFEPKGFELAIKGLKISDQDRDEINQRIEMVWQQITQTK